MVKQKETFRWLGRLLAVSLITVFCNIAYADVCSITNIRLGGQPGDAYIGPTCNNDGTYRTCFYVSGQDLPANNANYKVVINNVQYPIAFTVQLSPSLVVVCATGIPADGTIGIDVSITLDQGCSRLAIDLYNEPVCPDLTICTITNIRLGGQPGDAYIGPTCNNDGTYRTCFYITGQALPANNADYQIMINGVEYPIAFTVQLSPSEVVVCATGIPADGTVGVSVYVRLKTGCDFTKANLYTEPVCPDLTICTITNIRLGGQPGDAFIGPTCNNDGTYRTCFYVTGQALPAQNPEYQLIIDGVETPIAAVFTDGAARVICATNIPANGTQGVSVYIRLKSGCDFTACPLYNEPSSCPGGTFPPDPNPGVWNTADIGGTNGSSVYDPCNIINFTLNAYGASLANSDKHQLVYQNYCGDVMITAHVSSLVNAGWAGLEIRENLTPGSKMVGIKTKLSSFINKDVRTTQNGIRASSQLFRPQASWLRLVRTGANIQGFTSSNGLNWQLAFAVNLPMSNCINVGMYVESLNSSALTTAVFDNVSVSAPGVSPLVVDEPTVVMDSELPEEKWAQLRVYPNPASDEVTIDVDAFMGQKVNITLYSLTGQMISRHLIEEVQMPNETILLHNLESGTYLLRLETKDRSLSQKLVVQKF